MTAIADLIDPDEVTKITNLKITNVDLVGKAANGRSFILRKSADDTNPSIFDANQVREFAKQAQEGDMTKKNDTALEEVVAKADDEILEDAPAGAEGDVNDPGSPAWEAVDAATAWALLSQLNQVKRALECLTDREGQEAFNGDEDGYDNAWDLSTAAEQVECAIALVAPYAVGEQDESEQPVEKSVDKSNAREILAGFVKAGRALSSSNEQALRAAAASIQNVLASLPAEDVTKGADMAETETVDAVPDEDALAKATETIEKAKGDPQVLVYDANGNVLGSVDTADLTTFAAADAPTDAPAEDAPADDSTAAPEASDAAPAPDAPADAEAADVAPDASPDAAVIPGTDTVQSPVEADDTNVTKALATEFADALTEALAPLAKKLEENSELASLVKGLQERVEQFGKMPDDRRSPILGAGTGVAGMAARDGQVDELAGLRKAVEEAVPTKKVEAQSALAFAAIKDRFRQS